MDCVIKNKNNAYIRLGEQGQPIVCNGKDKMLFTEFKAKNIVDNLPKTLKNLRFKVELVPEIKPKVQPEIQSEPKDEVKKIESEKSRPKVLKNENYSPPESVTRWVDRIGVSDDMIEDAKKRRKELNTLLSNADKEISNLVHQIEFTKKIDMYGAWQERNYQNELLEKRRYIKDEMIILDKILMTDFKYISKGSIRKAVDKLSHRKFRIRIIEEDEENDNEYIN